MSRKILIITALLTIAAIIVTTAGCGTSTTSTSSSSSTPASTSQQAASTGQKIQQGQNQGGQRGPGFDNTKMLARAAEILSVSVDKLTTAFNNAMPQRTEGDRSGTPPTGTPPSGTPPAGTPPEGQQGSTPPAGTPPAGGQQGQPGQFALPDDVIQKIATELGLSADAVSSAFKQAMSELQTSAK